MSPEAAPPDGRRDLYTISAAFFFAFVGAGACQPFVVDFLVEVKQTPPARAAFVLALVYITFAVFRFFIGRLLDLTGIHAAKILGIATYALFPLLIFRFDAYPAFLLVSTMWGLGAPLLWNSSLVQIIDTSPPTRYGTAVGILRGSVMLATFVGSWLLAALYGWRGYGALFTASGALGLLGVGLMALSPNRGARRERPAAGGFLRLIRSHEAKLVCAMQLFSGVGYGVVLNGFKSHVEHLCGAGWLQVILPLHAVAGIAASLLGGRLCDLFGRWPAFTAGFALGTVGLLMGAWAAGPVALMAAMLLIGVQFAVIPLAGMAWIGDVTTPADRPAVSGYVLCFRDIGVAGAILAGGLFARTESVFLLFGAASGLCAAVSFVWSRTRDEGFVLPTE